VFTRYSFDELAKFPEQKLRVLYMEARRQQVSLASMIALMVNKPNQDEAGQTSISDYITTLTDPYKIVGLSDGGWDVLKAKKHIR
jgi:hypothetical protein